MAADRQGCRRNRRNRRIPVNGMFGQVRANVVDLGRSAAESRRITAEFSAA
jgi:hypothetical protein